LEVPATVPINANAAKAALRDAKVRRNLRGVAMQESSRLGVAQPAKMQAVGASDHQAAAALLSGAIVDDHVPVYVVNMTGGPFTATHHPPGEPAPQGNVLTVTIDAATNRVTDIGIVDDEPDLNQLDDTTVDTTARSTALATSSARETRSRTNSATASGTLS
jgi:hypothetical protein